MMDYQPQSGFLKDRIILVTGAGDGIGRAAALSYARYGARLVLLGRTATKLVAVQQHIANEGGIAASIIEFDLLHAKPDDYCQLAQQLQQDYPYLDGLLHNAGILGTITPLLEQDYQEWLDVMQVNVNAPLLLTRSLMPMLLKSRSASLIFTSSSVGRTGRERWGAYAVSKFATEGMVQILAEEYKNSPVRINAINPGGTRTAMRASAFPDEEAQKLKTPADIMPTYLYLMGDDSQSISGSSVDAQPGRQAGPAV